MGDGDVHYANPWSKWLFQKTFEEQFIVTKPGGTLREHFLGLVERVAFTPGGLGQLPIDRPVFIIGLPRSGTTLLYHLLCAHEQAAYVTNAMHAYPSAMGTVEWGRKAFRLDARGDRFLGDSITVDFGSPAEPNYFLHRWFGRTMAALHWPQLRADDLSAEQRALVQEDVRRILLAFGGLGRRWVAKSPVLQTELLLLQDLFPDAHFVHIVRDPRPTANSLVKLHKLCNAQLQKLSPGAPEVVPYPRLSTLPGYVAEWGADDLRTTAHLWVDAIEEVHRVKGQLAHFTEVRYEDLLAHPREELERLFSFAGMFWPEEGNAVFAREFGSIGQLRHKNAYQDYALVESITRGAMERYGYR